jgi:hypothetical protein
MSERDQPKTPDVGELPVQSNMTLEAPPPTTGDIAMDPELQAFIGRQLQATYDEVLNEPVPDRFLALLEQLEKVKAGDPAKAGEASDEGTP